MHTKNSLTPLIKKVLPAVVAISVTADFSALSREKINRIRLFSPGKKIKVPKNGMENSKMGSGSGFLVDPTGIVISNRHVICDPNSTYTITTNDNREYKAKILARDPISDIAILKIEDHNKFPVIKLGNSTRIELGEEVIAIGNALGLFKNTVSAGIISGLSRSITAQIDADSPLQEIHGLIQTDAAINPGNSGGPLVNLKGETVGINMAVISGAENISFALPINTVKKDLEDLKKFGRIKRPFLGVHYMILNNELKERYKLDIDYGALVASEKPYSPSVVLGSPADKAGIQEKDVIIRINGEKICSEKSVSDILDNHSVGDILNLKILRGKKELDARIILGERK